MFDVQCCHSKLINEVMAWEMKRMNICKPKKVKDGIIKILKQWVFILAVLFRWLRRSVDLHGPYLKNEKLNSAHVFFFYNS